MPATTFNVARFAEAGLLDEQTRTILADLPAAAAVADLQAARDALVDLAERLYAADAQTADTVDTLRQIADGVEAVDGEIESRGRLAASAATVLDRLRPTSARQGGADPTPTERAAAMTAHRPARAIPRRTGSGEAGRLRATVTAGGVEIHGADQLVEKLTAALDSAGSRPGRDLHQVVASARWTYPADRQLTADPSQNWEITERATGPAALTASGGICAPTAVDYGVDTLAVTARPVTAALPAFGATRGGLRFIAPPVLGTVAASTAVWTHQTDASPGGSTKALYTLTCPSETEVLVDAVTSRIRLGNMQGRFAPEFVAATVELAAAAHARTAETAILTAIHAGSTEVTAAALLGATSDLLADVSLAAAALRYRQRMTSDARVRVIAPAWTKDLLRSDLARQLPGNSTLAVSDAQLEEYFTVRGIAVAWSLDGVVAQGSGNTYAAQGFGTAQATGALHDYPASVVLAVYPEGTWQFLDGGQLDLGVVRDSTLNATNDCELFSESFEAVAKRGTESLKVIAAARPTGTTSSTLDVHTS